MGRGARRFGGPGAGERPGRRRHQSGQLGQPLGVFADEHRNPYRLGLPAPFGQAGQELLPGRQGGCQRQGVGPVGQVRSDGHAGFQDMPLVARLQQLGGLLRLQLERGYGPWPDARLGSRLGRGAAHGAGRHGCIAPAGQPSHCAGEAAVARFEADRFGHDLRLGAVGVFSSRLPARQLRAWLGVLAPEDKVSLYLGGMQDEHGVVQYCVDVSVCYGAGVWQEPGGCQEQPGWTGHISSGAGTTVNADGDLTRFRRWGLDPPYSCPVYRRLSSNPPNRVVVALERDITGMERGPSRRMLGGRGQQQACCW